MKVMMMVGLPGSGKSFIAEDLSKKENAVIISTDDIRRRLFGDETKQGKARVVFRELHVMLDKYISEERNIIIDSTNIERSRRMSLLKKLRGIETHCYYLDTPYDLCLERNSNRKRKVKEYIMKKMRTNLEFPMKKEGFSEVHIIHESKDYGMDKEELLGIVSSELEYDELFNRLNKLDIFKDIYKFDQENPYHQFLLCEHTYYVYHYINEYYEGKDKYILQLSALLHDIGKPFTKKFRESRNYFSYFGHENVSSQITCNLLMELGFGYEEVINVVNIVQMHMLINYGGDEGAREIYHLLGDEVLTKLYFFREADIFAK